MGFVTTIMTAFGERLPGLLGDLFDDLAVRRKKVVAAHARLAGQTCRDHDDIGPRGLIVPVRTRDRRIISHAPARPP